MKLILLLAIVAYLCVRLDKLSMKMFFKHKKKDGPRADLPEASRATPKRDGLSHEEQRKNNPSSDRLKGSD